MARTPKAKPKAKPKRATKPAAKKRPAPKKAAAKKTAAKKKPAPKKAAPKRTRTTKPAAKKPAGGARVVEIVDNENPISALRRFLSTVPAQASISQGQIALGSAQLMLLPIAREHRGGPEVKELIDLVLARWEAFPDRAGFHAQEFLRNAFAAVGNDPPRIHRLAELVPTDASAELHFNIASAYAIAGDKPAMLAATERALAAGISPAQIQRDGDFAPYAADPALAAILERAAAPTPIPVDVEPYLGPVRDAVDNVVATIREYGEGVELAPPAQLDDVLALERARRIALPNEYRALLTLHDGMTLWGHQFLGTKDLRGGTSLANAARAFLEMSADYGATGIEACVPLANWGQPNNWLLYDPRGAFRSGEPGYVILLTADEWPQDSLVAALHELGRSARDVLGAETN